MLRKAFYVLIVCIVVFFFVHFYMVTPKERNIETIFNQAFEIHQHIEEEEQAEDLDSDPLEAEIENKSTVENEKDEDERIQSKDFVNIVGIGDSLTQGVGDSHNEGYIGILKRQIASDLGRPVNLTNYAKRGQRSEQLIKRLQRKELQADLAEADFIFLTIGANDMMRIFQNYIFQLDLPLFLEKSVDYRNHLYQVFEEIRFHNPNAPVYMIGIFNPFFAYFSEIVEIEEVIEIWNESSRNVAISFPNVHFIPIDNFFLTDEQSLLANDNFHPNREGYAIIAEQLLLYMYEEGHIQRDYDRLE